MMKESTKKKLRRKLFFGLLIFVSLLLAFTALAMPTLVSSFDPGVEVGQVALDDYRAPTTTSFTSEVLTEQRQDAAERGVFPIYTSPDTSVGRQQLERLRTSLDYISSVRADSYATTQQKLDDLAAMGDLELDLETAEIILGLTDQRWQTIQQESLVVLEKLMSSAIRPENVTDVRNRAPNNVSLSLPESQASIVAELAAVFVAPNSEYSEELTEAARQRAREAVEPVRRAFVAGQTIVSQGAVLTESDVEALAKLELIQPESNWQDLVSALSLILVLGAFLGIYLAPKEELFAGEARGIALLIVLFVVFMLGARLVIPTHTVLPYIFPLAAYSLTVMALFGAEVALVTSLPLVILTTYGLPNALDLTLYFILGSWFGVLVLGRAQRITSFFRAGTMIVISGIIVLLAYRLSTTDTVGLATLMGAAAFNGLASAGLAVLLQFFLSQFLGMVSPMQLMELTRPDHPLLQRLLQEIPGTYQHSLQVANLAEQAAERVGADPLLTRVGALYHDVGKSLNPVFFIENQVAGLTNPHDLLSPEESARIIHNHVTDGLDLGQQHRLPRRILDFISEHHGTMITRYQYITAVKAVGGDESQVDIELFRYPGPRPRSKETAILMLADGSEARVRAEKPGDAELLSEVIKSEIDSRVSMGQLDDTNLTLHDLTVIQQSFAATLRGIYHPRVKYPKLEAGDPIEAVEISDVEEQEVPIDIPVDASPPAS